MAARRPGDVPAGGCDAAYLARLGLRYFGLREIPAHLRNPSFAGWLETAEGMVGRRRNPWYGTFAAAVMQENGIQPPAAWYRQRRGSQGSALVMPTVGCIVVFGPTRRRTRCDLASEVL